MGFASCSVSFPVGRGRAPSPSPPSRARSARAAAGGTDAAERDQRSALMVKHAMCTHTGIFYFNFVNAIHAVPIPGQARTVSLSLFKVSHKMFVFSN